MNRTNVIKYIIIKIYNLWVISFSMYVPFPQNILIYGGNLKSSLKVLITFNVFLSRYSLYVLKFPFPPICLMQCLVFIVEIVFMPYDPWIPLLSKSVGKVWSIALCTRMCLMTVYVPGKSPHVTVLRSFLLGWWI